MTSSTAPTASEPITSESQLDDGAAEPAIEDITLSDGKALYRTIRLISILCFLLLWELSGRFIAPRMISYPTAVFSALIRMSQNGELLKALIQSGQVLLVGFGLATIGGIVGGLLIGRYRRVEGAVDWLISALYATPLIAITPLIILWFGLGFTAKVFIVFLMAIFPIIINTVTGVKHAPEQLTDVGKAFAATELQMFTKFIFPAAVPFIMTGIRLAIGRGFIGLVVAEFYTSIGGLGALILKYGSLFDAASMFVPMLVLTVLAIALTAIVRQIEERFAPWREVG